MFICPFLIYGQATSEHTYTIEFTDSTMPAILKSISRETPYEVIFSTKHFDKTTYTFQFIDSPISSILDRILSHHSMSYSFEENLIVIFKKSNSIRYFGYIIDELNKEKLPYAVILDEGGNYLGQANDKGFYSISVPRNNQQIKISYLGYNNEVIKIDTDRESVNVNLALESNLFLPEAIIDDRHVSKSNDRFYQYNHDELVRLSEYTPAIGGGSDLIQTLKSLPGINTGSGGIGALYLRGGGYDQNLILLDGMPIYNPFHAIGLTSIFSPITSKSVQIYTSGIPASLGDRSTGVIDIQLKQGSKEKRTAQLSFNLQDAAFILEQPIKVKNNKISTLFYARQKIGAWQFNSIIQESLFPLDDSEGNIRYGDYLAKLAMNIGEKNELQLSTLSTRDRMEGIIESGPEDNELYEETQLRWGTDILNIKLTSILGTKSILENSIGFSNYFNDYGFFLSIEDSSGMTTDLFFNELVSKHNDLIGKTTIHSEISKQLNFSTGAGIDIKKFSINYNVYDEDSDELEEIINPGFDDLDELDEDETIQANKYYGFFQITWEKDQHIIRAGIRNTLFTSDDQSYFHIQPRMYAQHSFSPDHYISFSIDHTVQYIHVLSSSDIHLPRDVWLPSFDVLKPESSWIYNLAWNKPITNSLKLHSEIYYRISNNRLGPTILDYDRELIPEDFIGSQGKAESYGLEMGLIYSSDNCTSRTNYSIGKSTLTFDDINQGIRYPFQFDRQHIFKSLNTYKIRNRFVLGLNLSYSTGHPYLVSSDVNANTGLNPLEINPPGMKNNTRTSGRFRADLSIFYPFSYKSTNQSVKLNFYNIFNNSAPLFWIGDNPMSIEDTSPGLAVPFLASLSYSLKF